MNHDIENNIEGAIRRLPHFSGKHAEQGIGSYGPFGFLNPTGRRSVFSLSTGSGLGRAGGQKKGQEGQNHEREESEEEVKNRNANANGDGRANEGEKNGKKEEEIRAEDVQRLYRTRDNRKGTYLFSSQFFYFL
jgi:hypothetical protein